MPNDEKPTDEPQEDESRPVAVSPSTGTGWEGWQPPGRDPDAPQRGPGELGPGEVAAEIPPDVVEIERPGVEIAVGALCAALAASVFLPWYKLGAAGISGWSSGAWAPVVFGLGLLGVATVVLRRLRIAVAFPLEHSLVLEGIGWVSVILMLVKRFWAPRIAGAELQNDYGMIASLVIGLAVALVGGMVSRGAPLVLRPGWFASSAGKLGAALLVAAVALGGAFGVVNDVGFGSPGPGSSPFGQNPQATFEPGFPACMGERGAPEPPKGITATQGIDQGDTPTSVCLASMTTKLPAKVALARYRRALKNAHWQIVRGSLTAQPNVLQLNARKGVGCIAVSVFRNIAKKRAATNVTATMGLSAVCDLAGKIKQSSSSPAPPG
jgi:hypothetical protein